MKATGGYNVEGNKGVRVTVYLSSSVE